MIFAARGDSNASNEVHLSRFLIGLVLTVPVRAADWPKQPVTVVVPFSAGGNTDTMARMVSQRLQERLGQPFVVDNRGGAGGAIAMAQIARAPADGYTLVFAASPQIQIVPLLRQVNYDPIKDFVPISVFGAGPFVLGVQKSVPAQNLRNLSPTPNSRAAKSITAPAVRARWRISPVRCSRNVPDSKPRTFPTRAVARRWEISSQD